MKLFVVFGLICIAVANCHIGVPVNPVIQPTNINLAANRQLISPPVGGIGASISLVEPVIQNYNPVLGYPGIYNGYNGYNGYNPYNGFGAGIGYPPVLTNVYVPFGGIRFGLRI